MGAAAATLLAEMPTCWEVMGPSALTSMVHSVCQAGLLEIGSFFVICAAGLAGPALIMLPGGRCLSAAPNRGEARVLFERLEEVKERNRAAWFCKDSFWQACAQAFLTIHKSCLRYNVTG